MHEMQSVVTDDCGVCPSVCHTAQLGFTVQKWIKMLFWVKNLGVPWSIMLGWVF